MSQYRIADAARSDLEDIWSFIAKDNPDAADEFIQSLVSKFPILGSTPLLGRSREALTPNLRSLPFHNYLIFYRPVSGGVEIVRILHGARDIPPLFE